MRAKYEALGQMVPANSEQMNKPIDPPYKDQIDSYLAGSASDPSQTLGSFDFGAEFADFEETDVTGQELTSKLSKKDEQAIKEIVEQVA